MALATHGYPRLIRDGGPSDVFVRVTRTRRNPGVPLNTEQCRVRSTGIEPQHSREWCYHMCTCAEGLNLLSLSRTSPLTSQQRIGHGQKPQLHTSSYTCHLLTRPPTPVVSSAVSTRIKLDHGALSIRRPWPNRNWGSRSSRRTG